VADLTRFGRRDIEFNADETLARTWRVLMAGRMGAASLPAASWLDPYKENCGG
jgi:hypothetical protein